MSRSTGIHLCRQLRRCSISFKSEINHLDVNVLPQPAVSGGQRVLFHSGDDADAKAEVRKIIEQTGYFPVDLGMLDVGGPLASLPFGSLAAINLVKI